MLKITPNKDYIAYLQTLSSPVNHCLEFHALLFRVEAPKKTVNKAYVPSSAFLHVTRPKKVIWLTLSVLHMAFRTRLFRDDASKKTLICLPQTLVPLECRARLFKYDAPKSSIKKWMAVSGQKSYTDDFPAINLLVLVCS